jgi:hypothetical protein
MLTALHEGLHVDIEPTSTAMHGWLPDQAALFGMLTWIRLHGLELIEIRRLPHGGQPVISQHSVPRPGHLHRMPERKRSTDSLGRYPAVTAVAEQPPPDRPGWQATAGTPRPPGRAIRA